MSQTVDAIFENGVFRPQDPVDLANGERVSLIIAPKCDFADLSDVADLLDGAYLEACRRKPSEAPSLEDVRKSLQVFGGSLSDVICAERHMARYFLDSSDLCNTLRWATTPH